MPDATSNVTSTTQCSYHYSDQAVSREIYRAQWRRTIRGLLSVKYSNMQQRCKGDHQKRYEGLDLLPRYEFMEWGLNDPTFNMLFEAWHEAGCPYRLTPSIDRIDTTGGYTLGNIRFLTHSDNARRGAMRRWHGAESVSLDGVATR